MRRFFILAMIFGVFSTVSAQEERLQVAASYTILADVVQNVAGDAADVTTLMPVNADPHTFEPTPRDLTVLADADVIFVNGALFEEGLLESIESAGENTNILEASTCVEMIAYGAGGHDHSDEEHADEDHSDEDHSDEEHSDEDHADEDHSEGEEVEVSSEMVELCSGHEAEFEAIHDMREVDEDGEEHDHEHGETLGALYAVDCGEGHDHDDEDGEEMAEGDHDHEHGACDPHVWMNPHNVMYWTMMIRDTLVEMDPNNADAYTANAEAYLLELDSLMHDFIIPSMDSIPEANRVLVTNHESLGYLANYFEMEVVATVLPGNVTGAEPSTAAIADVIDTINEEGVSAIFAETTVSDDITQQVANETGAEIFTLYSGSLSAADGPAATYIDYMTYNVGTIADALSAGEAAS